MMKKSSLLLLSIISLVLLSGCSNTKLEKVLKNMNSLNNYTMKMEYATNDSKSTSITELDVTNNIIKETSVVKSKNNEIESVEYIQLVDDKAVSYSKGVLGDNWLYNESSGEFFDIEDYTVTFSQDASLFKKVKSDRKGFSKYQVNTEVFGDNSIFSYVVECYIYTDGKYITSMEYASDDISLVISFSDFNNTTVVIPDDVKENAKKIGEIDFSDIDLSQYNDIDISDIDNDAIKEQIEKAKEYMNSDEFKNQMQEAQDYMNSDEFKEQMQKAQDYMNSEEYQRQMQEAQERARAFLNR